MDSKPPPLLLLVDDDELIRESLALVLSREFRVETRADRASAIAFLRESRERPALALIDLGLPPQSELPNEGFRLIGELLAHSPGTRVLVLTGQNESLNARRARALGAIDFVPKPCEPAYLKELLARAMALDFSERDDEQVQRFALVGASPPIAKLRAQIDTYAASSFPVLIEGESGTGKERVAQALHALSPRAQAPFLALNCAAISPTLIEATLFGHSKGAFTGAAQAHAGYFEDAAAGTLFLDEIGELPADVQAKLLRVLENGEYQRLGETTLRTSRARVVAATNRDLREAMREQRFRADLYHRLSVFTIVTPPLRELSDDKLALLAHFQRRLARDERLAAFTLDAAARQRWRDYPFPGNVRELRNIVIRLTAKHPGGVVDRATLEEELDPSAREWHAPADTEALSAARVRLSHDEAFRLDAALAETERAYVRAALDLAQGSVAGAAKLLGLARTTLYSRMDALGLSSATTETEKSAS